MTGGPYDLRHMRRLSKNNNSKYHFGLGYGVDSSQGSVSHFKDHFFAMCTHPQHPTNRKLGSVFFK